MTPHAHVGHHSYRAPQNCPVCGERLHTTRLGCSTCGTELSGAFSSCEFCALTDADRALLKVFLVSRGTMREVEKHLGVSYPTARARFDELLGRLGYRTEPAQPPRATQPATSASGDEPDPRLATLQALARGEVDLQTARTRLSGAGQGGDEI